MSNDFASTFCCSTAVRIGLHSAPVCHVALQAYVPAVIFQDNVCFASDVTRVGDEVSNVTSVNTVLQNCTGKVASLNIQIEITYSTTVVEEFNTTMALLVLMERCNFVSAGAETIDSTEGTGHFTLWTIYQGFRTYIT